MIKEIPKTVTEKQIYCDLCQKECVRWRKHDCKLCRRDLCSNCVVYDDSDYPDAFCPTCWNAGTEIRELVRLENLRSNKELERLADLWINHAKEIREAQEIHEDMAQCAQPQILKITPKLKEQIARMNKNVAPETFKIELEEP